jgi:hypothetical protein
MLKQYQIYKLQQQQQVQQNQEAEDTIVPLAELHNILFKSHGLPFLPEPTAYEHFMLLSISQNGVKASRDTFIKVLGMGVWPGWNVLNQFVVHAEREGDVDFLKVVGNGIHRCIGLNTFNSFATTRESSLADSASTSNGKTLEQKSEPPGAVAVMGAIMKLHIDGLPEDDIERIMEMFESRKFTTSKITFKRSASSTAAINSNQSHTITDPRTYLTTLIQNLDTLAPKERLDFLNNLFNAFLIIPNKVRQAVDLTLFSWTRTSNKSEPILTYRLAKLIKKLKHLKPAPSKDTISGQFNSLDPQTALPITLAILDQHASSLPDETFIDSFQMISYQYQSTTSTSTPTLPISQSSSTSTSSASPQLARLKSHALRSLQILAMHPFQPQELFLNASPPPPTPRKIPMETIDSAFEPLVIFNEAERPKSNSVVIPKACLEVLCKLLKDTQGSLGPSRGVVLEMCKMGAAVGLLEHIQELGKVVGSLGTMMGDKCKECIGVTGEFDVVLEVSRWFLRKGNVKESLRYLKEAKDQLESLDPKSSKLKSVDGGSGRGGGGAALWDPRQLDLKYSRLAELEVGIYLKQNDIEHAKEVYTQLLVSGRGDTPQMSKDLESRGVDVNLLKAEALTQAEIRLADAECLVEDGQDGKDQNESDVAHPHIAQLVNQQITSDIDMETLTRLLQTRGFKPDIITYTKLIGIALGNAPPPASNKLNNLSTNAHSTTSSSSSSNALAGLEAAQELYNRLLEAGLQPTRNILHQFLSYFVLHNDPNGMQETFAEFRNHKYRFNIITATILMTPYAKSGDWEGAWEILREGSKDAHGDRGIVRPDDGFFNAMLKIAADQGDGGVALRLFRMMRNISEYLDSFGFGEGVAERYVSQWSRHGPGLPKPTHLSYVNLMRALVSFDCRYSQPDRQWTMEALAYLSELEESGVRAKTRDSEVYPYLLLMKAFARLGDVGNVDGLLRRCVEGLAAKGVWGSGGVPIKLHEGYMECLLECGESERARMHLEKLEAELNGRGGRGGVASTTGGGRGGEVIEGLALSSRLTTRTLAPFIRYAEGPGEESRYIARLFSLGLRITEDVHAAVLQGRLERGEYDRAEEWWNKQMSTLGDGKVTVSAASALGVLRACQASGDVREAKKWFDRFFGERNGFMKPTAETWTIWMQILGSSGELKGMEKVLSEMKGGGEGGDGGRVANHVTYLVAMTNYAEVGDCMKVESLIQKMITNGIPVGSRHQTARLMAYSRAKRWADVDRIFGELENGFWVGQAEQPIVAIGEPPKGVINEAAATLYLDSFGFRHDLQGLKTTWNLVLTLSKQPLQQPASRNGISGSGRHYGGFYSNIHSSSSSSASEFKSIYKHRHNLTNNQLNSYLEALIRCQAHEEAVECLAIHLRKYLNNPTPENQWMYPTAKTLRTVFSGLYARKEFELCKILVRQLKEVVPDVVNEVVKDLKREGKSMSAHARGLLKLMIEVYVSSRRSTR